MLDFVRLTAILVLVGHAGCSIVVPGAQDSEGPPAERATATLNVSIQGQGSVSPDGGEFEVGTTITLAASPDTGWRFDRWSGDAAGADNPLMFEFGGDSTVIAVFVQVFEVNVDTLGGGTVNIDPTHDWYDAGTVISILAVPDAGWRFDHWEGDLAGSQANEQLIVQSDVNIVAVFEVVDPPSTENDPDPPPPPPEPTELLHLATIGGGTVSVSPDGQPVHVEDGQAWLYAPDERVLLSALDQPGDCFFRWRGDVNSTQREIEVTVSGSLFLLAEFVDSNGPPPAPSLDPVATHTSNQSVIISGHVAECQDNAIVAVEIAGPADVVLAPVRGGVFTSDVPLGQNRTNALLVTAISDSGVRGKPASVHITHDAHAPELFVDFPRAGSEVTTDTIDVAGRVADLHSGFMGLRVDVNDVPAHVDSGIGTNGTFFRRAVPLPMGPGKITVVATDVLGNSIQRSVEVTRVAIPADAFRLQQQSGNAQVAEVNAMLADPIVVRVTSGRGAPLANKVVTLHVTRSDGQLSASPSGQGGMTLQVHTDTEGLAQAYWRLGSDSGEGNNRVEVTSTSVKGTTVFCASALSRPASQINVSMGNNQIAEVGAPLAAPLSVWISDGRNGVAGVPVTFTVVSGGGRVNDRREVVVESSATGHTRAWLELGLESGNQIVEASFPGNAGLPARFVARGVKRDVSRETSFVGLVLDNAGRPLQGAECTLHVGGAALPTVVTSLDGRFRFDGVPESGRSDLFVDGSAVFHAGGSNGSGVPLGTFPKLHYEPVIVPNAENSLATPVLLPPLDPNNEVVFDNSEDVELTVDGIDGLRMIVRAGSMTRADGSVPSAANPAVLSLNQVHFNDVPMPFPDGAAPPFAWTLQPGGSRFDPPVAIELPNMSGLAPGAIVYLLSFNHDTNRFEIVASGQVSDDGSVIRSDPGSGISTAGWGGNCPPYPSTCECKICPVQESQCPLSGDPDCPGTCTVAGGCGCSDGKRCTWKDTCTDEGCKGEPIVCGDGSKFDCLFELGFSKCDDIGYTMRRRVHAEADRLVAEGALPSVRQDGGPSNAFNHIAWQCLITRTYSAADARYVGDLHEVEACRRSDNTLSIQDTIADLHNNVIGRALGSGIAQSDEECFALALDIVQREQDGLPPAPDLRRPVIDRTPGGVGMRHADPPAPVGCPEESLAPLVARTIEDIYKLTVVPNPVHMQPDAEVQLTVLLHGPDGSVEDRSSAASGTQYQVNEQEVATVSVDGSISSFQPGSVQIEISVPMDGDDRQGLFGAVSLLVASEGDMDSDGIDDDYETRVGLNPFFTEDGGLNYDDDRLDNLTEFLSGTDPFLSDTDGDGRRDDVEIYTLETDPLTFDIGLDSLPWTIALGGQVGSPNADGSISIGNISAPARAQLIGYTFGEHETRFVFGPPLELSAGRTFVLTDLTFLETPPPLPESIRMDAKPSVLAIGEMTQLLITGVLADESMVDLTAADAWTDYTSGNPAIATVSPDGLVTGVSRGAVFITATNFGTTGVKRIDVESETVNTTVEGFVLLQNAAPVSGANVVTTGGGITVTGPDGSFAVSVDLPIDTVVTASVHAQIGQSELEGVSEEVPIFPDGVTDVGIVTLEAPPPGPLFGNPAYPLRIQPVAVTTADFNGDGHRDIAAVGSGQLAILLGNGRSGFADAAHYDLGVAAADVAAGDLDGDGDLDLVLPRRTFDSPSDMTVVLNAGDGTFAVAGTFDVGLAPRSAGLGDLDRDGDLDVVVVNRGPNIGQGTVSVLLNHGDGSLAEEVAYGVGLSPSDVAIGDLTGDGSLDLAVTNEDSDGISLLFNDGAGTFITAQGIPTGNRPRSVAFADFDGDGNLDLLHTHGVHLNNGKGAFGPAVTGGAGAWVAVGDLDGDGDMDFVGTNGDSYINRRINSGDGTFIDGGTITAFQGTSLLIDDLNADGASDIVMNGDLSAGVLFNLGGGEFQSFEVIFDGLGCPQGIAAGDVDGDNDIDLAVPDICHVDVGVLINQGDTTFRIPGQSVGTHPLDVVTADLNGDGRPDLATANSSTDDVSILIGNADGTFQPDVRYAVGQGPRQLELGDFNGDASIDIVSVNRTSNSVSILLNNGDGTYADAVSTVVFDRPRAIAAGDINRDGHLDLAIVNQFRNPEVRILSGNGDGTFAIGLIVPLTEFASPDFIHVDDFNDDSWLDVVVDSWIEENDVFINNALVMLNAGDGTLGAGVPFPIGDDPENIISGDVNRDGIRDLITANNDSRDVSVLIGHGDGTFAEHVSYTVGEYHAPFDLTAADVNGDGWPDLAVAIVYPQMVTLLVNQGDGTFGPPTWIGAGNEPFSVASEDFNGDGFMDLAVANDIGGDVSVLLNDGTGEFPGTNAFYGTGLDPRNVSMLHADDDGALDLAVVNEWGGSISVFLNRGQGLYTAGVEYPVGDNPWPIAVSDLDGNGTHDIATSLQGGNGGVSVLLSVGDGTYFGADIYAVNEYGWSVDIGDINGDATPDIAFGTDRHEGQAATLINRGDGTFGDPSFLDVGFEPEQITLADLNGDAYFDLVAVREVFGTTIPNIAVLINDGAGGFSDPVLIGIEPRPYRVVAGDLDLDGDADIIMSHDSQISVLLNNGFGVLSNHTLYVMGDRIEALSVTDLNGDGRPDIAASDGGFDGVTLLLNHSGP